MTNKISLPTRLVSYINALLPDGHGHQRKGITDFVFALITVQSCCQSTLARFFDNYEAAKKRLSRLLHNNLLDVEEMILATGCLIVSQLPRSGRIRIAIDWTTEDKKHLLVASLIVGRRAIPIFWKAYSDDKLKDHMREYEKALIKMLITKVLKSVDRSRLLITADRGFADIVLIDLLDELGVAYVIRTKGNVKVYFDGQWRKLSTLHFRTNQRRRALGRLRYCESSPRKLYLTHARERDRNGKWGIWFLLSNRRYSAYTAVEEYARRFGCEEGFKDSKRMLGFADAQIEDLDAWSRMFTLVAIALLVLVGIGCLLLRNRAWLDSLLRKVRSRRRKRSELSLVRAATDLLNKDYALWELLDHNVKLNLEASL